MRRLLQGLLLLLLAVVPLLLLVLVAVPRLRAAGYGLELTAWPVRAEFFEVGLLRVLAMRLVWRELGARSCRLRTQRGSRGPREVGVQQGRLWGLAVATNEKTLLMLLPQEDLRPTAVGESQGLWVWIGVLGDVGCGRVVGRGGRGCQILGRPRLVRGLLLLLEVVVLLRREGMGLLPLLLLVQVVVWGYELLLLLLLIWALLLVVEVQRGLKRGVAAVHWGAWKGGGQGPGPWTVVLLLLRLLLLR